MHVEIKNDEVVVIVIYLNCGGLYRKNLPYTVSIDA